MEFHIFRDKAGRWRWHLLGKERSVLAESAYGYLEKADCRNSIDKFKGAMPDAPVFED